MATTTNGTTGESTENSDDESTTEQLKRYGKRAIIGPLTVLAMATIKTWEYNKYAGRVVSQIAVVLISMTVSYAVQKMVTAVLVEIIERRSNPTRLQTATIAQGVAWALVSSAIIGVLLTVYQDEIKRLNEMTSSDVDATDITSSLHQETLTDDD